MWSPAEQRPPLNAFAVVEVLSESTRSTDRPTLDAIGFEIDLGAVCDDVSTLRSVAVVDDDEAPPIP